MAVNTTRKLFEKEAVKYKTNCLYSVIPKSGKISFRCSGGWEVGWRKGALSFTRTNSFLETGKGRNCDKYEELA